MKESRFVSLGRRREANCTILAIARGRVLPEAVQTGREELDNIPCNEDNEEEEKKKCQLK